MQQHEQQQQQRNKEKDIKQNKSQQHQQQQRKLSCVAEMRVLYVRLFFDYRLNSDRYPHSYNVHGNYYILSIIPLVSRSQPLHADHAISVCRLILSLCLCHGDTKIDNFFQTLLRL